MRSSAPILPALVLLPLLALAEASCTSPRIEHVDAPRLGGLGPPLGEGQDPNLDEWARAPEEAGWQEELAGDPDQAPGASEGPAAESTGVPVAAGRQPGAATPAASPAEGPEGSLATADDGEGATTGEDAPEASAPAEPGAGATSGDEQPARPSVEPPADHRAPLRASALAGATLVDPEGTVLARVGDLVLDPGRCRLAGAFASTEALGEEIGPFVDQSGFLDCEEGRITLGAEAARELCFARREAETEALFRHRELEVFEGGIASDPAVTADERLASITLVEENNHRHRVLLAPLEVLAGTPLVTGSRVRVLALPMRAEEGPYLVAASVSVGDQVLQLRDEQGRPSWDSPSETPRGWRFGEMRDRPAEVDGVQRGRLVEVLLDPVRRSVTGVLFEGEEQLIQIPCAALRRNPPEGSFQVDAEVWWAGGRTPKGARDAAGDDAPR